MCSLLNPVKVPFSLLPKTASINITSFFPAGKMSFTRLKVTSVRPAAVLYSSGNSIFSESTFKISPFFIPNPTSL